MKRKRKRRSEREGETEKVGRKGEGLERRIRKGEGGKDWKGGKETRGTRGKDLKGERKEDSGGE